MRFLILIQVEFAYYFFFLIYLGLNRSYGTVVSLETIPDSRPTWAKFKSLYPFSDWNGTKPGYKNQTLPGLYLGGIRGCCRCPSLALHHGIGKLRSQTPLDCFAPKRSFEKKSVLRVKDDSFFSSRRTGCLCSWTFTRPKPCEFIQQRTLVKLWWTKIRRIWWILWSTTWK